MVTGLLNDADWHVSHKRVERIWRREGLNVPQKQKEEAGPARPSNGHGHAQPRALTRIDRWGLGPRYSPC
ncbi:hypothetical protein DFK10_14980 [Salibaculum griseiflavum]|uniref:Uncharacterized protein n=1 Tax=Salibaculum griseiflavum TaxID=1914409 RepID=A0A2V1NZU3_9RHOB|nr:hypothetical protein DFK10_14980 [Salibaculum griseiflavum]